MNRDPSLDFVRAMFNLFYFAVLFVLSFFVLRS